MENKPHAMEDQLLEPYKIITILCISFYIQNVLSYQPI